MFDFAHILYIGLRIGLRKEEVAHMYYGRWSRLFDQYRHEWNMKMKQMVYAEQESESSVLSL